MIPIIGKIGWRRKGRLGGKRKRRLLRGWEVEISWRGGLRIL